MKHYLFFIGFMTFIFYTELIHCAEYKYAPKQTTIALKIPASWTVCATLAGIAIGIGLKSGYDRFFCSRNDESVAHIITEETIDKEVLQQKLKIDLAKLVKVRETVNGSEMAGKRAERNTYDVALQQLAKGSYRFFDSEINDLPDRITVIDVGAIEEKLKTKINEIYCSHKEKFPVYDSDDELRKKHSPRNTRASLTAAALECRDHWQQLNNLQKMRIAYADLADEINRAEIKVKNLEAKVEKSKAKLAII